MAKQTSKLIALAGLVAVSAMLAGNVRRGGPARVAVQTERIARRDLVSIVTAPGEVKPRRYAEVGANVSGRIAHVYVRAGDPVRKGQMLARVEWERFEAGTRQWEAEMQAARADADRADADFEVAQASFARTQALYADQLVSRQQYDQDAAELKMKRASAAATRLRVARVQAEYASSRDDLAKTTVVSPMDGVVTSIAKGEGEVVIGAQSFNPSTIMVVADLSEMVCDLMVYEADIGQIAPGQPVNVHVEALRGVSIQGSTMDIASAAVARGLGPGGDASGSRGQGKDFKVTVALRNPPRLLRPGLTATGEITVAQRSNVVTVPIQAVVSRRPSAKSERSTTAAAPEQDGVFVLHGERAVFRPIRIGIAGESGAEVLDGAAAGDVVVTGPFKVLRQLTDGALVKNEPSGTP